jgi:hypothetical protein
MDKQNIPDNLFKKDIEELAKDPDTNYDKLLKIYQLLLQKYYLIKYNKK